MLGGFVVAVVAAVANSDSVFAMAFLLVLCGLLLGLVGVLGVTGRTSRYSGVSAGQPNARRMRSLVRAGVADLVPFHRS
ncbi:MAG: hypothetical protein QOE84_1976 [Actinomycetota bacterium]|nr:hypothetical protein [Actinomycetota bacterium]